MTQSRRRSSFFFTLLAFFTGIIIHSTGGKDRPRQGKAGQRKARQGKARAFAIWRLPGRSMDSRHYERNEHHPRRATLRGPVQLVCAFVPLRAAANTRHPAVASASLAGPARDGPSTSTCHHRQCNGVTSLVILTWRSDIRRRRPTMYTHHLLGPRTLGIQTPSTSLHAQPTTPYPAWPTCITSSPHSMSSKKQPAPRVGICPKSTAAVRGRRIAII